MLMSDVWRRAVKGAMSDVRLTPARVAAVTAKSAIRDL